MSPQLRTPAAILAGALETALQRHQACHDGARR